MNSKLSLLALLLAACPAAQPPAKQVPGAFDASGPVVLTVDGHEMHQEVLDLAAEKVPADQLAAMKASGRYKEMVEQFAIGNALYHEALAKGLADRRDVQLKVALSARDALTQSLLEDVADAAVTDEAIAKAYEERKVRYIQPGAKIQIAIFRTAEGAKAALDAVHGGKTFADAVSANEGAVQDLDWQNKGELAGPVDGLVFGSDTIGVMDPVDVGGRSLLVNVTERRDSTPLEAVKEELRTELQTNATRDYIEALRGKIKIEWKQDPAGGAAAPAAPAEPAAPAAPAEPAAPATPAEPSAN